MVDFVDHRHDIHATIQRTAATIQVNTGDGVVRGSVSSPQTRLVLKDYQPIDATLAAGFRYHDQALTLSGVRLAGKGLTATASGVVDPVSEGVYDFRIRTELALSTAQRIFEIEKELTGDASFTGELKGNRGSFSLQGTATIPHLKADVYELAGLKAGIDVTGDRAKVRIESGEFQGGRITGTYLLSQYAEPYPMAVNLHYSGVSLEGLLANWDLEGSGLRGAATGTLRYSWEGNALLEGKGSGTADLNPGARAFGNAPYPMPVSGRINYSFAGGTLTFRDSTLKMPKSQIAFSGTLRLEDLVADLQYRLTSESFREVDKLGVNLAHALGTEDFELLGLGGTGVATGRLHGPFSAPTITANVQSSGTEYGGVALGTATIRLTYDGARDLMRFEHALFRRSGAQLELEGTIGFPKSGPSPRFDLIARAEDWPVQPAMELAGLDYRVAGTGTGTVHITGTPEDGKVDLQHLTISQEGSRMALNGSIAWRPGEGNVSFNLDVGAESVPVTMITDFLDLGSLPIRGEVTGTLHLEGPKEALGGAGSVTVRNGSIAGEPIEQATADILFTQGSVKVTHLEARSAAGVITGQAEYNFNTEEFSYIIQPTEIDLSKVSSLGGLADLIGGTLHISSSAAGTLQQPEVVVEATLENGRIRGADLPPGMPPPKFYLAIRDGRMIIQGSAFGALTVDGNGSVGPEGGLDGLVHIAVSDLKTLLDVVAPGSESTVSGRLVAEVQLGGNLGAIETVEATGRITQFDVEVSGQPVTAKNPIEFALRDGAVQLDSISLETAGSTFFVDGSVSLVGNQEVNLEVRGAFDAGILQVVMSDLRSQGTLKLAIDVGGSLTEPRITGTVELQNGSFKFPGFPQLIENVRATLVFRGDRIEIDSLRASFGGGTVVAGGYLIMDGLNVRRVRLNAQGTDVALRYFEGMTAGGDFDVILSGDAERMLLQGKVSLDRGVYTKNFDLASSLLNLLLERRVIAPEVAASWQSRVALQVDITANDTLAVRNNIADVTASADLQLTGTLANPVILGRITLNEGGELTFQDVDYNVVQGTVNFQNPFRNDPYFDITAESLIRRPEGDVELTVNLTGTLDRITPTITSDPPIGDLTLLSLISGELTPSTGGAFNQGSLTAAGTSLILQSIGEALGSKILPFADVFRLDPGLLGDTTGFTPTVTFEKRISRDVYVIVVYNTGSTRNREIVQWQVTPDWVIQFTRDSDQSDTYLINAVDARFRRRYEGHW